MKRFVLLGLLMLLYGCAAVKPATSPSSHDSSQVAPSDRAAITEGWWTVAIHLNRPDPRQTQWHLDLLLAHKVFAPVIVAQEKNMVVWRFHRRAADDVTGHRFSFIFYADKAVAEEIYRAVQADPVLLELKQRGRIAKEVYADTATVSKPDLADTSDSSWSPVMKASWPIYINGVSQTWLTMIDIYVRQLGTGNETSGDDREELYRRINQQISESWHQEGQHAFLHHLNAIFGYEPMAVKAASEMRF